MRIVSSETESLAGLQRGARSGDSGNVMVIALLVLLVLTTAGVAYVAVTKSEKQIAGNSMIATQALYAAEAGITEGLHRMSYPAESLNYMGPVGNPVAGWGRYVVLVAGASALDPDRAAQATDGMDNNEDGLIDEPNEHYPEVLTKQAINANTLRYPYVRVEYKTQGGNLVRYGDADNDAATPPVENFTKGAPVLRITARGRTGNADKILEAEAVRFPLVQVEGAVWAGGTVKLTGNSFFVDGHDHHATAPFDTVTGAPPVPGVLTEGPATDCPATGNQVDNVSGAGGDGSVQRSPITYNFNSLWSGLSSMADNSYSGDQGWSGATATYGSLNNPKITAVNGNLDLAGGWTGGGILVVNGNLKMAGGSTFFGVVIVLGDVDIGGGASGDIAHVTGGLIFQGTVVDDNGIGGSSSMYYSTEAINAAQTLSPYQLSWWRER